MTAAPAVVASDQLVFWLFQSRPDRILQLLVDLPADVDGYRFTAPALKAREHRLDGLFLPPVERPTLPAFILEAQMAADPGFGRQLYAESARLLQQKFSILHWRVVVPCPSRQLNDCVPEPGGPGYLARVARAGGLSSRHGRDHLKQCMPPISGSRSDLVRPGLSAVHHAC